MSADYEAEYAAELAEEVKALRSRHPDRNYPATYSNHDPGECLTCDAIRTAIVEDIDGPS